MKKKVNEMDTSNTNDKNPTVYTSKENLKKTVSDLNGTKANVVVTKEEENMVPKSIKLEYLSEVKDAETGEISQPFTIKGKKYQMVRALTSDRKKVMGVYSHDEVGEDGSNVIYDVNEFEKNIAKKEMSEEGVVEPEGPEMATLNPIESNVIGEPVGEVNPQSKADEMGGHSFAGYKHYIVNKKTGKARKFKSIEELAKANMTEDEQYMGIRDFKKYVDEVLFGAGKRQMKEVDAVPTTPNPTEQKMVASADKLMKLITTKIPKNVFDDIQKNHIAQREVLLAFANVIGVSNVEVSKIINGIKGMAKEPVTENVIKTVKVKDIL